MRNKIHKKQIAAIILLLAANLVLFLTIWLMNKYDQVYLDQVIFQMKSSSEGVHNELANSAVIRVGLFGILLTAVEVPLYGLLSGAFINRFQDNGRYIAYCGKKICYFFKKRALALALILLLISVSLFTSQLDVRAYVATTTAESDFIEEHYVDPDTAVLHFPENKRNLIYIFLESMENTYADTSAGTPIVADYIPQLTKLAKENVNFSHTSGIGGAQSFAGTTWTAAAMATQTSGVPVKVSVTVDGEAYGAETEFLPGITTLGDILEQEGYHQTLLVGSDAEFHGRQAYFTQHGNYEIVDIDSLKKEGRLAQDYEEWWGFEDQKLFAYAKEELTRLADMEKPFNFTMLTADTHFPDGYECPLCQDQYEEQYANVLSCSSKQVYEFVSWIQKQDFYENTTIIISGDHLTMDAEFLEDVDEDYVRTVYNCIINAPIEPVREKDRQFGTFDMLPTTLAAMGIKIDGDRLGLGVNLFSAEDTLTEQYGFKTLDQELQKNSEFYNVEFLEVPEINAHH